MSRSQAICPGLRAVALSLCLSLCALPADPALTIYNQQFAVVHQAVSLDLQAGSNTVRFSGATSQLEPESVILRDPANRRKITILEQNYRADALSQDALLNLFEGKTIDFLAGRRGDGSPYLVRGKIIRAPHPFQLQSRLRQSQAWFPPNTETAQPIIEVDGKLQFFLPGQPLFPNLGNDTILKPLLNWTIFSREAARFEAELSYVTGGLTWAADYNLVADTTGDSLDVTGWVTLENQSGTQFDHAHINLMAGEVSKLTPANPFARTDGTHMGTGMEPLPEPPGVTERTFDEYHLYSLPQPTTLRDRETKQIQFIQASGISSRRLYVYDGLNQEATRGYSHPQRTAQYDATPNPNVWVMREFKNSAANQLGLPLPKGRLRFYRRDADGRLEFVGENEINHTPKDEIVRVYTGNAFDISGDRRQTHSELNNSGARGSSTESIEITLHNHKTEAVTVHVVEHLNNWQNWAITQESSLHVQNDSRTIEYEVALQPDERKVVAYTVHYSW